MDYKSLKDIYTEAVNGKMVPPLPRQAVRLLIKEEDDSVKVYKQEQDDPATLEGEVDKEYYNDVISPAINRGGDYKLSKIVKERLVDAHCYTDKNYNMLVDFFQAQNITITEGLFTDCQRIFLSKINANENSFQFMDVLAEALNANGQSIDGRTLAGYDKVTELYDMLATDKPASADRSQNAGPGEVFIAFFTKGKKLSFKGSEKTEEEAKGDIEVGGLRMELKGVDGRLKVPNLSYDLSPEKGFKDLIKKGPLEQIRYIALGSHSSAAQIFKPFEKEVISLVSDRPTLETRQDWTLARDIGGYITFKIYAEQNRLNAFLIVDKYSGGGLVCIPVKYNPGNTLTDIKNNIKGRFYLQLDRKGAKVKIGKRPETPSQSTPAVEPVPQSAVMSPPLAPTTQEQPEIDNATLS